MDDRQLRIWYQLYFSMFVFILWPFLYPLVSSHILFYILMMLGLLIAALMGYLIPPAINLISGLFSHLVYEPTGLAEPSGYRFYQEDMERAKGLVRKEQWDKAIQVYREIIEKTPDQCEPRFHLAKTYQKAGYLGLALNEYSKIIALKDRFGPSHPFVIEAERTMKELKGMPFHLRGISPDNSRSLVEEK